VGKVMIKISQGSANTQTVLGGLTIIIQLQIYSVGLSVPEIMTVS